MNETPYLNSRVIVKRNQGRIGGDNCPGRTGTVVGCNGIDPNLLTVRLDATNRAKQREDHFQLKNLIFYHSSSITESVQTDYLYRRCTINTDIFYIDSVNCQNRKGTILAANADDANMLLVEMDFIDTAPCRRFFIDKEFLTFEEPVPETTPMTTTIATTDPIDSTAETLVPATQARIDVIEAQIAINHEHFKRLEQDALRQAIKLGNLLTALKPLVKHGEFENYVNDKFGITRNRSSQWMRIANEYALEDWQTEAALPANLPSYSAALELLESRNDTPEIKAAKTQIKEAIMVDGQKYTVAEIKALKEQISTAESTAKSRESMLSNLDEHLKKSEKLVQQLQQSINEKESAISELHVELTEMHKQTGDNLEGDITAAEERLAELEEQARDKKKELAKLTAEIFEEEKYYAINKELEAHTEKLKKSLYPHIANLQAVRKQLTTQPVCASTASYIHETALTLIHKAFDLYELSPRDLTFLEKRFSKLAEDYRERYANEQLNQFPS